MTSTVTVPNRSLTNYANRNSRGDDSDHDPESGETPERVRFPPRGSFRASSRVHGVTGSIPPSKVRGQSAVAGPHRLQICLPRAQGSLFKTPWIARHVTMRYSLRTRSGTRYTLAMRTLGVLPNKPSRDRAALRAAAHARAWKSRGASDPPSARRCAYLQPCR